MESTGDEEVAVADDAPEAIRCYIDHVHDRTYVRATFTRFGMPTLLTLLEELLRSGEHGQVQAALLFTEDTIRFGLAPRAFADAFRRSRLPGLILQLVYAPDFTVRHLAVHAASRLGPRENGRYLAAAVPWYLAHDPLGLSELLMELRLWNKHTAWRSYLESMVEAPLRLTRWAAVEMLWEHGARPIILAKPRNVAWPSQLLRTLAQDRDPLVRQEAQWCLDQVRASRPRRGLPRWGRAQLLKRLRQGSPEPTFFKLSLNVGNYLGVSQELDYDVTLVDAIIEHLQTYSITSGYDIDAYWRPLATARHNR
jgi:hypothetical protein